MSFAAVNIVGTGFLYYVGWSFWTEYDLPVIMVVGFVLQVLTSLFLCRVATTDPGYIPRQEGLFAVGPIGETPLAAVPGLEATRTEINVNGLAVKLKFCTTCKIIRPPRTSHCGKCDMCVERFDHHCPWIGNCVGKRNYGRFFIFLFTISVAATYTTAVCLAHTLLALQDADSEAELFSQEVPEVVIGLIALAVSLTQTSLYTCGLFFHHIDLVTTAETTYERIKRKKQHEAVNQRDSGDICENWSEGLCPDLPFARMHLRTVAEDLDSSRIHVSPKAQYIGLDMAWPATNALSDREAGVCEVPVLQTGQSTRVQSREDHFRSGKVLPQTLAQSHPAEGL